MFDGRWIWCATVAVFLAWAPSTACGASWAWPVSGPVSLAYGSPWADDSGRTCTHGGLDISADPGGSVQACASGRVAFAGRVPAAGGGSTLAVSVTTADGLKFTCMPLSKVAVSQGQDVSRGSVIGSLAAAGDGSFGASHLHLTVRRGEVAIDPVSLLEDRSDPAPAVAPGAGVPRVEGGGAGAEVRASIQAPARAAAPRHVTVASGQVPQGTPAPVIPSIARNPEASPLAALEGHAYPATASSLSQRIRPLPPRMGVDIGAASTGLREWMQTAGSIVTRLMLAALGGLLIAPVMTGLARTARSGRAVLAPATIRRARR